MKPKPEDKAVLPGGVEIDRAALDVAAPAPSPDAPAAASDETVAYLTWRHTEAFGPSGRFVDLPPTAAAGPLEAGDLVVPTPEQLARRL